MKCTPLTEKDLVPGAVFYTVDEKPRTVLAVTPNGVVYMLDKRERLASKASALKLWQHWTALPRSLWEVRVWYRGDHMMFRVLDTGVLQYRRANAKSGEAWTQASSIPLPCEVGTPLAKLFAQAIACRGAKIPPFPTQDGLGAPLNSDQFLVTSVAGLHECHAGDFVCDGADWHCLNEHMLATNSYLRGVVSARGWVMRPVTTCIAPKT